MARNATVSGSKYFAEIKNPKPNAETMPAYAGQQAGHINFGSRETPTPGSATTVRLSAVIVTSPRRGLPELGIRRTRNARIDRRGCEERFSSRQGFRFYFLCRLSLLRR